MALFLTDHTQITVEPTVQLSSVCFSICLSLISHECIVAKWCKIGPRLLLITNRKSHIGFQMK